MARARKKPRVQGGIVVGTIDRIWVATERMKCAHCEKCYRDPRIPGQCIYGGPYGVVDGIITQVRTT